MDMTMSCDGFFSAYPSLTTKHRSLKSSIPYVRNEPMEHTLLCYDKYQSRGFDLAFNSKDWDKSEGKTHQCQLSWRCPHTIRSTYDGGCMFVPFRRFPGKRGVEGNVRCFEEKRAVVWYLGGETCEDSYEPLRPFTTTVGAFAAL